MSLLIDEINSARITNPQFVDLCASPHRENPIDKHIAARHAIWDALNVRAEILRWIRIEHSEAAGA